MVPSIYVICLLCNSLLHFSYNYETLKETDSMMKNKESLQRNAVYSFIFLKVTLIISK